VALAAETNKTVKLCMSFSGFQTHNDRYKFGTETVRDWRAGCVQGGAGKISQIAVGASGQKISTRAGL